MPDSTAPHPPLPAPPPDGLAVPRDFEARRGAGLRLGRVTRWGRGLLRRLAGVVPARAGGAGYRPRRGRAGRGHVRRIARGLPARGRPPRPLPSDAVGAGEGAPAARRARSVGRSPPQPAAGGRPVHRGRRRRAGDHPGHRPRRARGADARRLGDGAQRCPDPGVAPVAVARAVAHLRGRLHGRAVRRHRDGSRRHRPGRRREQRGAGALRPAAGRRPPLHGRRRQRYRHPPRPARRQPARRGAGASPMARA